MQVFIDVNGHFRPLHLTATVGPQSIYTWIYPVASPPAVWLGMFCRVLDPDLNPIQVVACDVSRCRPVLVVGATRLDLIS